MAKKRSVIVNKELADVHREVAVKRTYLREVVKSEQRFDCLSDKLAEDKLCHLNYYYPGSKIAFPQDQKYQTVDKYYPYAKGGPLFIDEPSRMESTAPYLKKQQIMKELGHRYLLVLPGMSELDCYEALA